ncbi:hypothetical protein K438DRAFT_1973699 [Mycena galopus ATCC 62051]|nr:hypothetical protein K438DRAFT_1973699 [Mycena galopus ATCC 62051]
MRTPDALPAREGIFPYIRLLWTGSGHRLTENVALPPPGPHSSPRPTTPSSGLPLHILRLPALARPPPGVPYTPIFATRELRVARFPRPSPLSDAPLIRRHGQRPPSRLAPDLLLLYLAAVFNDSMSPSSVALLRVAYVRQTEAKNGCERVPHGGRSVSSSRRTPARRFFQYLHCPLADVSSRSQVATCNLKPEIRPQAVADNGASTVETKYDLVVCV